MKNAKKLALLLLSLVLLIGVFAVWAFAEEGSDVLTLKYQDGTVQTYKEGDTIEAPAVPKDFIVYDEEGKAYKFTTAEGAAWENVPAEVTPELIGETVEVTVAGEQNPNQVYYVTEETIDSVTNVVYHMNNNVHQYLSSANTGDKGDGTNTGAASFDQIYPEDSKPSVTLKIKLYADVTANSFATKLYRDSEEQRRSGIPVYFDLNGHTYTNNSATVMHLLGVSLRIYSSVPGAHWYQKNSESLGYADNDATMVLGNDNKDGAYSDNISFHCKNIVNTMHGSGCYIFGGKFYQIGAGGNGGFLNISRRLFALSNAEFYLAEGEAAFVDNSDHDGAGIQAGITVYNCSFYAPSMTDLITATKEANTEFRDCVFINFNMAKNQGAAVLAFIGNNEASHGGADVFRSQVFAKVDPYAATGLVAEDGSEISASINFKLTAETGALKVNTEQSTVYYKVGTAFSDNAGDFYEIVDGNKINSTPKYVMDNVVEIVDGKVASAGEITLDYEYTVLGDDFAFSYLDTKTSTLYAIGYATHCGGTAAGVGAKFYELFNNPASSYTITMYKDMEISKAMAFGPSVSVQSSDGYNRDYYNSLVNGEITWDLNGTTVTIAANTDFINISAANFKFTSPNTANGGAFAVFGLEGGATPFTVKSSAAGAKILNLSNYSVFGIGEGTSSIVSIQGENITIETAQRVVHAQNSANNKKHVEVNGGTYIYKGVAHAFALSGKGNTIENATVICVKNVAAMFAFDKYRNNVITIANCTLIAPNNAPLFTGFSSDGGNFDGSSTSVSNSNLLGVKPVTQMHDTKASPVTYSGTNYASSAENLAIMGSAPEGEVVAFTSLNVNGVYYKMVGYFADVADNFVTVHNEVVGTTEPWVVGSTYVTSGTLSGVNVLEIEGVWYYRPVLDWSFTVDGNPVANACDPANGGKTVDVAVGGETFPLYYSITEQGVTEYFYGDKAENEAALLAKLLALGKNGFELKLYSDMETKHGATIAMSGSSAKFYVFDLNGFDWHIEITKPVSPDRAMTLYNGVYVFYSTQPGANMSVTGTKSVFYVDTAGTVCFGERNVGETENGKNFTLECNALTRDQIWASGLYLIGGTYIQNSEQTLDYFINLSHGRLYRFDNVTIILNNASAVFNGPGFDSATITNVNIISANKINLFVNATASEGDANVTISNSNFYNVYLNNPGLLVNAPPKYTFTGCNFNVDAYIGTGYIAYTGENVVKNIAGKEYTFTAAYYAEVGAVNWGFGIVEYWAVGARATHEDVEIDGYFAYTFDAIDSVVAGDQAATKTVSIRPGTIQMNLTLQSKIGLNIFVTEALSDAIITVGGTSFTLSALAAEDAYYKLSKAIDPNVADGVIEVTVQIGENVHELSVSIGNYAKKILATDAYADVHNLTYAMAKYVEAMTGTNIVAGVEAPAGYVAQTVEAAPSENDGVLLENIRFNLADTIAIEILGAQNTDGKTVSITLASGRVETAVLADGTVLFTGLNVNEFYGDLTIAVEDEEYTYSLANYLAGLTEDNDKAVVQALHNYTYYADLYMDAQ